ncbi:MAG: hypothetical protein H2056_07900, partial [Sphingopyxis sp.]|nr:hypothetical protein [Sphingopyxis sp.]
MKRRSILVAAALAVLSGPALADTASREVGVEASITFPSNATIRNYRADGERGVWIEDRRRNWYYASFFGRCRNID